ncbi:hypothetical protein [Lewinella sp. IMCC34191]|uniref:hypothetical protein n=1 Tax=Lewinella sp. IMCC34191 TaxID=2259172 RepID=UPI0013009CAE|nr:hypothetical protein [Lewinella sp. IMCC34191]
MSLVACTDSSSQADAAPSADNQPSDDSKAVGQRNSSGGLAWASKRYERVLQMENSGVLDCDTLSYDCQSSDRAGKIIICRADGDLVRVQHEIDAGPGTIAAETYYYDGSAVYVAETSAFSQVQTAESPGPGLVRQERRYFESGNLLDREFRSYPPLPEGREPTEVEFAYEQSGDTVDEILGSDALFNVAEETAYDCDR